MPVKQGGSRSANGASRTRTGDLLHAEQTLSQLSYGPATAQCSREFEIDRPIDPGSLIVPRGTSPELDCTSMPKHRKRKEVAAIRVGTVRGEGVNLVGGIRAPEQASSISSTRVTTHDDHVGGQPAPFALHTDELRTKIEDQVVALDGVRRPNANPQLCGLPRDLQLGDDTLLI
jgi:hypothetical protein